MNEKTDIEPILKELKKCLEKLLGDTSFVILLYGSRARGDSNTNSDIDIAIIVKGLSRDLKKQILNIVAELELKYLTPLSTIIFSDEGFNDLKKRERRLALDIEKEGIPV